MINSRKRIVVLLSGLAVLFIMILGVSYAYYVADVNGNTSKDPSLTLRSGYLAITYQDGQEFIPSGADGTIIPGEPYTKTFTVKNDGVKDAYYGVWLKDVVNPFTRTQDWTYTLKVGDAVLAENIEVPTFDTEILSSRLLAVGATEILTLTVTYANTSEDQSVDMNKTLEFNVSVVQSSVA